MKKQILIAAGLSTASLFAAPANAALLLGNNVGVEYYFPTLGNRINDSGALLVGTDGPVSIFGIFNIGFNDTSATASFGSVGGWSVGDFNGLRIYDFDGTIDAFTSVTFGANNMVGLDDSRISFDQDNIYINWQGLSHSADTLVTIDINAMGAVPEPATWAFMIFGFGAIGGAMRRQRKANVKVSYA